MLTVPKLPLKTQTRNNHTQSALSYPFPTYSTCPNLDFTPQQFYIKSQIPFPNNNKGKQNIPLKKKENFSLPQNYNLTSFMSKINNDFSDPLTEIHFLPQKNKVFQTKQSPTRYNKTKKHSKDCLSPNYNKSRQENQKILLSLKLENEKYKKLIQQNQFLNHQHNTYPTQEFNFYTHRDKKQHFNFQNIIQTKKFFTNHKPKALEEISCLTTSFVFDEIKPQTSFNPDTKKKSLQNSQKFNKFDFEKIKFLGKGNFGQVNLVRHKKTNFICAMKTIKKSFVKEQNVIHQISREIRIHLSLKHLNIISFYGFFDDDQNVYFLMQYATGGQLFKRLKQCYRMSEKDVIPIIKDTLDGLRMIHSLQYIHRDLKPENIIFQFGIAKICDMGWAADCKQNQMRKSFCGTPLYLPPQMIKKEEYDQSADIWSIGILTYELLVGKIPFNIWSNYDLQQIVDREIVFPTNYVDMSETSIDFIKKCLERDPHKRIKLDQLIRHPFLKIQQNEGYFNVDVYDSIEKLF